MMLEWECGLVLTRVEARAGVRRGTRSPVQCSVQCSVSCHTLTPSSQQTAVHPMLRYLLIYILQLCMHVNYLSIDFVFPDPVKNFLQLE